MTNLTEQQRAVVDSTASKILVVAGPGSGKTHTMVARIGRLLERGQDPAGIVCITFTNAGAKELEKRLVGLTPIGECSASPTGSHVNISKGYLRECQFCHQQVVDNPPRLGYLGTLHGFALRELQRHGSSLGYQDRITVLDEKQAEELLLEVAKRSGYKGTLPKLETTLRDWVQGNRPKTPAEIVVAQFFRELRVNSAVTFETILVDFLQLLELEHQNAETGCRPAGSAGLSWEHLIVDEYQDSGSLDARIYAAMTVANRCFVGDPDQAIYGFRGASVRHIMELAREPGLELHTLELNFRCAPLICSAANRLIGHNQDRLQKLTLSPGDDISGKVLLRPANGIDDEERTRILDNVRKLLADGVPAMEMAILCRYNSTVGEFAQAAEAMGLPVRKKAEQKLPVDWGLTRAAVELLNAPYNSMVARTFAKMKWGAEKSAAMQREADLHQHPMIDHVPVSVPVLFGKGLDELLTGLSRLGISRESLDLVRERWEEMTTPTLPALSLAMAQKPEHHEMGEGVTITTIHGAKGREWGTVYVVAMEQEIMPGKRDLEEERRIAFVAITRAKARLVLSAAVGRRQPWGNNRHAASTPSQFFAEVEAQ